MPLGGAEPILLLMSVPDGGPRSDPPPATRQAPAVAGSRWERLKRVFGEALDLPAPDRAAFVASQCGSDVELRQEIEALLESDGAAGSFCETPAAGLLAGPASAPSGSVRRFGAGSRLDNYEITGFVSAGGMGEVYRARDVRLGRDVAIKTVSAELGGSAARSHLLREARHASSLSHPNICTVHEVGDVEGLPFIVMEFVEGRPLNEAVREHPFAAAQAITYGLQIASALDHAHRRGVVHRDLKSSNVIVTPDGRPVVLDFGLARRLPDGERQATETTAGGYALAGTLSYMSPEVLLGHPADARTDVWAMGVLLYEMLTGELPFAGRTPFETSSAIINEPPRAMPRSVPLALRLVVERCLQKDPAVRYQQASDLAAALETARRSSAWRLLSVVLTRRPRLVRGAALLVVTAAILLSVDRVRHVLTGANERPATTLAVLPLDNAAGGAADQYYVDGIADGLIEQLGALEGVRVLSRASTVRYRSSTKSVATVARELGATAVVQGALRRGAGRVAIDARLTEAATGRILWSDRYERDAREVLALQADVVKRLAAALEATVNPETRERLTLVRAVNPDVYEAYLKGRYQWNLRTQESLELAVRQFERTIDLDPTYAPAYAALADCYNQLGTVLVGGGSPLEYRPRAGAAAMKALQIDANSAEAHATLGFVKHYDWEWEEAELQLRRAIELNPSYALAHVWYANMLMSRKRFDEALQEVFAARELDPFSLVVNTNVGWVLINARRHDDAVAQLTRTLQMDPAYPQARARLVTALLDAGRNSEALGQALELAERTKRSATSLNHLAVTYARVGERQRAQALLRELLEMNVGRYVSPTAIGQVYLALGDTEHALPWLERAAEERTNAVAYFAVERSYDSVRSSPRFKALLARARLE